MANGKSIGHVIEDVTRSVAGVGGVAHAWWRFWSLTAFVITSESTYQFNHFFTVTTGNACKQA